MHADPEHFLVKYPFLEHKGESCVCINRSYMFVKKIEKNT